MRGAFRRPLWRPREHHQPPFRQWRHPVIYHDNPVGLMQIRIDVARNSSASIEGKFLPGKEYEPPPCLGDDGRRGDDIHNVTFGRNYGASYNTTFTSPTHMWKGKEARTHKKSTLRYLNNSFNLGAPSRLQRRSHFMDRAIRLFGRHREMYIAADFRRAQLVASLAQANPTLPVGSNPKRAPSLPCFGIRRWGFRRSP